MTLLVVPPQPGQLLHLAASCLCLWVEASGPLVPMPGCGASRFCFARWLLATCFLHSAHSVSHFTLPQAERSIHLVQTLLTGLGRRRPLLGRTRGGHEGPWSGQLRTDMSLPPPTPFPLFLLGLVSPSGSYSCCPAYSPTSSLHSSPLEHLGGRAGPHTS